MHAARETRALTGFTFVEILVAAAILSIVLGALFMLFNRSFRNTERGSKFLFALSDMSLAIERVKQDLRTLSEPSEEHMAKITKSSGQIAFRFFSVRGVLQDGTPVISPIEYLFDKGTLVRKSVSFDERGNSKGESSQLLLKNKLEEFDITIFSGEGKDVTLERKFGVQPARLLFKIRHKDGASLQTMVNIYSPYIVNRAILAIDQARVPNYKIMPGVVSFEGTIAGEKVVFSPSIAATTLEEDCLEIGSGMRLPDASSGGFDERRYNWNLLPPRHSQPPGQPGQPPPPNSQGPGWY
jgi:type II secretory pathway pseudopilin PulG